MYLKESLPKLKQIIRPTLFAFYMVWIYFEINQKVIFLYLNFSRLQVDEVHRKGWLAKTDWAEIERVPVGWQGDPLHGGDVLAENVSLSRILRNKEWICLSEAGRGWSSLRLQRYSGGSISSTFYDCFFCQYPFDKKSQSQTVTKEKLRKALLYKKCACKLLMKLTT